jgi:hypothetical protein
MRSSSALSHKVEANVRRRVPGGGRRVTKSKVDAAPKVLTNPAFPSSRL